MVQLSFTPFRTLANNSLKTTTLSINGKYVGKQYMDNTSSADRCIPAYFVSNLSLTHEFRLKGGVLGLGAYVNNLFNNMYYADGGASREMYDGSDEVTTYVWIYPQAPLNFMFKLSYRF
jgi:iron complex outermembrane receptor protein